MARQDVSEIVIGTETERTHRRSWSRLEPLAIPAAVLIAWQLASIRIGEVAVASPTATVAAIADGFRRGWLSASLLDTFVVTALGFVVAAAGGLWVGFSLGLARFWGRVLEGPILWLYSIPKVTLFPIFLLFLGLGDASRVAFGALHGFFPLVLFVLSAIRGTPPVLLKVGRVYNLNRWQLFWRIVVPDILPSMVTGLRYCFSLTFLGVILAEMFAAREGAGYELVQAIGLHRPPRTFAIAFALIIVALIVNAGFLGLQRRASAHRPEQNNPTPAA